MELVICLSVEQILSPDCVPAIEQLLEMSNELRLVSKHSGVDRVRVETYEKCTTSNLLDPLLFGASAEAETKIIHLHKYPV